MRQGNAERRKATQRTTARCNTSVAALLLITAAWRLPLPTPAAFRPSPRPCPRPCHLPHLPPSVLLLLFSSQLVFFIGGLHRLVGNAESYRRRGYKVRPKIGSCLPGWGHISPHAWPLSPFFLLFVFFIVLVCRAHNRVILYTSHDMIQHNVTFYNTIMV